MSQFNASKNPPWVRSDNFSVPQMTQPAIHQHQILTPQMPQVVQYPQNPGQQTASVYQAQLALQQQALTMQQNLQQMASAQQIYNPQLNAVNTTVGTRNLNAAAFAQPVVSATSSAPPTPVTNLTPTTTGSKQRVFTGIVTKVFDTYGFVDEDVFFQLSVVKGPAPVVNDRVLVEAVCLSNMPNMPFKWNATRIQVLPMNNAPRNNKKGFVVSLSPALDRGNYNAVPPVGDFDDSQRDRDRERDRRRRRSRERTRNRSPLASHDDEKRRRERREKEDKNREKEKDRERARSRSVKKSSSRQRTVKKYRVRVPEFPLDLSNLGVSDLRSRYHTLYVPSDFFRSSLKWRETLPPHEMDFSKTVQFHILSKEVDRIVSHSDDLEPPDADYLFCAKVMLLSIPSKEVMMSKCMQLTEDLEKDDGKNLVHPNRLINCLVGTNTKTKNEIMAIGGPWSPSLDGSDPIGDVTVLIKTAIRTCKALTGIDLTPCTHWYRFVEIYYHRPKSTHKGKQIPARVETVVIYMPDVWSAMPSSLEWDGLQVDLRKQMENLNEAGKDQMEVAPDNEKVDNASGNSKEPTHYSHLDPKTMKVSELRDELEARNMSPKGLRLQLLARLSKILKTEQETAEQEAEKNPVVIAAEKEKDAEEEKKIKIEKQKKKVEQKNRVMVEERYILPETPHILVFPSRVAKGGKFGCKVMSLSSLLDYSSDVTKEHSFEVFLFAELFNEMLMWNFGMQIYKAILNLPDADKKSGDSEKKDKEIKAEKGKEEGDDKSPEKDKTNEKICDERDENEKNELSIIVHNGNERERSLDSSEEYDDDTTSRNSGSYKKDKRDDRRDLKPKGSFAQFTAYPKLLLAFTFFDVTRYGSISKVHLEDLIHALGLQLSRSQVKKLVNKITHRDYCDYRKLTDFPVTEPPPEREMPYGDMSPLVEQGNKPHLPTFDLSQIKTSENFFPSPKRSKRVLENEDDLEKPLKGFFNYKSVLVNIDSLREQVTKNETARLKTEEKLAEVKKELEKLKEESKKSADEIKTLEKTLKSCQSKLALTTDKLSEQVASNDIYLSALMDIEERLIPILDTDEIRRLIKIRQSVIGAPSINLIPLTKVENVNRFEDIEESKNDFSVSFTGSAETTDENNEIVKDDMSKDIKPKTNDSQEKMEIS